MHRVRLKNEYTSNHNKKETELTRQERNGVNVMKTIIHKKPKDFDGLTVSGAVKRLPDVDAEYLVKNEGWEYCPKSVYKLVRDAFDLDDIDTFNDDLITSMMY